MHGLIIMYINYNYNIIIIIIIIIILFTGPDQTDQTKPAAVIYPHQTGPTGGNTQPVDDPAFGGGMTYQVSKMQDYK